MEQIPIPDASDSDRTAIADLANLCCSLGAQRYDIQTRFPRQLIQTFSEGDQYQLNTKGQLWWEHSLNELGSALKQRFQLRDNPMKNPRIADRWEQYLEEKRNEVDGLSRQLNNAEFEINDRIYRIFDLTTDEIELLKREVEH